MGDQMSVLELNNATSIIDRVSFTARNVQNVRVMVTEGPHAGAELVLPMGDIKIGSAPSDDLVLFAEKAHAEHCRVHLSMKPFLHATVQANAGRVFVNGEELAPGASVEATNDFDIIIGDTRIVIAPVLDTRNILNLAGKIAAAAVLTFAIVYGVRSAGSLLVSSATALGDLGRSVQTQFADNMIRSDVVADKGLQRSQSQALPSIREHIGKLGLSAFIRALPHEGDAIKVTGVIPPAMNGAWSEFLRWYDMNTRFPRLVREVIRGETPPDVPELRMVLLGDTPVAVFDEGREAAVGEMTGNNWRVIGISKNSVTIERDGLAVNLTY